MKRALILIGLSGSGKTSVGAEAARLLECPFVDLDERIATREGVEIATLFRDRGEPAFRDLEREAMRRALEEPSGIIAAGGGWAAQPGNLESVGEGATVVWLRVDPAEAARRLADAAERPLLVGDMETRLRRQLPVRWSYYDRADASCETDGRTMHQVAAAVAELARRHTE